MNQHSGKSHIYSILALFMLQFVLIFVLTACGNQTITEATEKTEKTEETSAEQVSFTKYSCAEYNEQEANVRMQLDINPSFILGLTAEGNVMSIEANNEDAEDVLLNCLGDYFNGVTGGVELEYVLRDLAEAVQRGGYIEDTLDVSVTILSGNLEAGVLEEACSLVTASLAEDDGIAASFDGVTDNSEVYPEDQSESADNDENKVCDLCNGEGTMVCDLCNGTGTVTETEEHTVEVRNGYVCPYCGGAGILDDGLHGGETAVCGNCGGDGAMGPMSGDFREKAYDTEIVTEEVTRTCSRCNGSGTLVCAHCEGTGVVE